MERKGHTGVLLVYVHVWQPRPPGFELDASMPDPTRSISRSFSSLLIYLIVFPPYNALDDPRFLVDLLPMIGLYSSLCLWQVTGCSPNH